MTPQQPQHMTPLTPRPYVTIGDLCQAIGEHRIAARSKDGEYLVRGSDLRRLARTSAKPRGGSGTRSRRPAC